MPLKSRMRPSAEFSSSSIADIVFLLLIFFLLTSQFVTQSAIQVNLPNSKSDKPSKGDVSVTIAKDGTYTFQNEVIGTDEMTMLEKEDLLVAKIGEYLADTSHTRVINLRGDTAISYGTVARVIGAVTEYGGAIAFQTKR